jgi:hypothetical protein
MTTKQEFREFVKDTFPYFLRNKLEYYRRQNRKPSKEYFNIRFDLQDKSTFPLLDEDPFPEAYFEEVTRRASTIFQSAFDNSDNVFLVFIDIRYRRRKLRLNNYLFKQINNLKKSDINFFKVYGHYCYSEKIDVGNVALMKSNVEGVNFRNILTAIGNQDFPPRQPRFGKDGCFTSKQTYFINIDKKLIFHMYDDRGLDLTSADVETLRPIYQMHNDLILEYDRKEIDKQFI